MIVSATSVGVGESIRFRCACGFSLPENEIEGGDEVYSVECLETGLLDTLDVPVCIGMLSKQPLETN